MQSVTFVLLLAAVLLTRHREALNFYDDFELTASFLGDDDVSMDEDDSADDFDY